ncbi:chromosome segregation protein SMC [Dissulfurimicrobium hydrothermale]|uniref:chromosome segregation protein SMC n=1 Tax=Dissulfurimicrobium hydrothermale TaxID=1750598 RepID=UPI001EDBE87B|nr:chromosome segregation protein SMC [Dissulfurimicrobium hydrothermale]UKL13469.1 chromosome segregation protein SMC [Dissulfurimicrobium hydrothermale]
MRLDSLIIYGFKSFPERTRLTFSKGISAIVGPNGCGKSNIVDAIRWVMGEQSPSILRAKSMENLICSGHAGKISNFAEVTLIIGDATAISLPWLNGAPDIEISRRLSRSGESEYRINGKGVRLKDIQYLFMDTGAGARAYAIVDQGKVGTFVDMDAEERRCLIEEAAGVAKYKARRLEAEAKLAQTKQNLERLEDLIIETEKQIKSLERQAKKTERYLTLRKSQEMLEKALLADEWLDKSDALNIASRSREDLVGRLAVLKSVESGLAAQKETKETELLELEKAIREIEEDIFAEEERLKGMKEVLSSQEKNLISEENRLKEAQTAISGLSSRREGIMRRIGEIKRDIEGLEEQNKGLLSDLRIQEDGINEAVEARNRVKRSLEEVKVELVDAASVCAKFDSRQKALASQAERLKRRLEALTEEKELLKEEKSGQETRARALEAEIKALEAEIKKKIHDISTAEAESFGLEQALSHLRNQKTQIDSSLAAVTARLNALRAIEDSMQGLGEAARSTLRHFKGLKALADLLIVKSGLESAAESALEKTIEAVIPEEETMLDEIIDFVKQKGMGDLRVLAPWLIDGPDSGDEDDGVAAARPPASRVIRSISSGWRLIDDLDSAIKAFREAKAGGDLNAWYTYITPSGDILYPWGEIVIKGGKNKGQGILSRKAEIARLAVEEKGLRLKSAEIASKEETQGMRLSDAVNRLKSLVKDKERLNNEVSRQKSELDRLKTRLESHEERQTRLDLEMDQIEDELSEVEADLEQTNAALDRAKRAKNEAENKIKGREDALRQQEAVLQRRQKVLEDMRIAAAGLNARLEEKRHELTVLEKKLARINEDIKAAGEIKTKVGSVLDSIRQSVTKTFKEVTEQEGLIETKRAKSKAIRCAFDEKRQELASLDVAVKKKLEETTLLEKELHQREIEINTLVQAMQFLKKTARERHQAEIEDDCHNWRPERFSSGEAKLEIAKISSEIDAIGPVNLTALDQYKEVEQRRSYLATQKDDLTNSINDLEHAIRHIDQVSRERLKGTIEAVNNSLAEIFPLLFDGGKAWLEPVGDGNPLEAGLDLAVHIPGKRIGHLNLLSGGEKALAAISLIFSLFLIKPSPFCLMDEVDAPLDEANTLRFCRLVKRIAQKTQMILVTHNQRVMEQAEALYGVTMEENGVSKLVSVKLT